MNEIDKINKEIENLKVKKKMIKRENGNSIRRRVNQNIRVSVNFDEELIDIQNKRVEFGIDERGKEISKPKLTSLIIKHYNYPKIKEDCIMYILENDK